MVDTTQTTTIQRILENQHTAVLMFDKNLQLKIGRAHV